MDGHRWLWGARRALGNRGAALVFVAVGLAAGMSVLALAVDLGFRFSARGEAQRAADAAALAGASAFMTIRNPDAAADSARARAYDYALRNLIARDAIDSAEVAIEVLPADQRVRVTIRREGLPTWFARMFGVADMAVSARAAAEVRRSGAADCVKPFAIPDIWFEADDDTNGNRFADPGEDWAYEPGTDYYVRFGDPAPSGRVQTGWGSSFRNGYPDAQGRVYHNDFGRPIVLKIGNPNDTPSPGFFYPWVLPGGGPGASDYRENIATCNDGIVEIGESYDLFNDPSLSKPGKMAGPTRQGVDALIDQDPTAEWKEYFDPTLGAWTGYVDSRYGMDSPRVIRVAFFDPAQVAPGRTEIVFNNIALVFLEGVTSDGTVKGRMLYYAQGLGGATSGSGTLVQYVQLVE